MTATTLDSAFQQVGELVARFKANEARYLSADYQEAEVRKDFIDKFFIALGWDVNHDHQTNPYEQEVKVEPSVSAAGQRRADYSFRLAPNFRDVRFFVEAKKPHGDIANSHNYFQTIRYGWNSETPLAVLTDFEQFHILDCRYQPDLETALNRQVAKYHYTDYSIPEKFAEIYWLFSREAVSGGSLEKRAKELPKPRGRAVQRGLFPDGYQSIDDSFLKELDEHRISLARTFKNKNPELDSDSLTEIVQRTLDRLVFLRFLEDKAIEARRFVDRFGEKGTAWEDFIAAGRRLDSIYNGIVFKKHSILDAQNFRVDDNAFAAICKRLSHTNSPYDFNAIPIHILGAIYERFLGKVIVATDKRVRVEDKPEVRKAGGVYYTPEYIVRYIVENTVGKLIAGKTPDQISEMRFADIACGSGSFLLGVYDLLLQYHGHYYNDYPKKVRKGECIEHDGKLYLSLQKKREILLNNIHGVDIDPQAVEVCQLSLYLKLLQEETEASAHQYLLDFVKQALLPSLGKNIICGNSLIGPDFYQHEAFSLFDEDRYRINVFDWSAEFSEIMKSGGFDAVIGNPPYVRQEGLGEFKKYFQQRYEVYHGVADLYSYFVEKGVSLLKPGGFFGFIVANKWMRANYGEPLRQWMKKQCIEEIVDFGDLPVFQQVTTYPCILRISKEPPRPSFFATQVRSLDFPGLEEYVLANRYTVNQKTQDDKGWSLSEKGAQKLLDKLRSIGVPLGEYVKGKIYRGVLTGLNEAFVIDAQTKDKLISKDPKSAELIKPFLVGRDIRRYMPPRSDRWLIFTRRGVDIKKYPAIEKHLLQFKEQLTPKPKNWKGENWKGRKPGSYKWYEIQDSIDYYAEFEKPKIIVPAIVQNASYAFDTNGYYSNDKITIIPTEDLFLVGIINSKVPDFFMHHISSTKQGGYFEYKPMYVSQLPIRVIDFSSPSDKSRHDRIVSLVDSMLTLHRQLASAKSEAQKGIIQRQIDATDKEIDRLVYELYGLTAEEIAIVEKAST